MTAPATAPTAPARRSRRTRLAGAVLAALALTGVAAACTPEQLTVVQMLNADRTANGLPELLLNPDASDAPGGAQAHANWMRDTRALQHSDNIALGWPAGWRAAGENVGFASYTGDVNASIQTVENAYMNSPLHRANILNPKYNQAQTGYAIGACPTAIRNQDGSLKQRLDGNGTCVYTVQRFAQY